ncbi:hypothetical protein EJ02DRAFT_19609 [Clathrospora elynae]|uniref:Uncharacterized protein n=1 Tax=Clathrospora elynae TaxID=706981 RepID=A0A6A5SD60_9PLEO|nr:hypothetical protein EJ02DRAFT_19609 [Clathrospora elynae]
MMIYDEPRKAHGMILPLHRRQASHQVADTISHSTLLTCHGVLSVFEVQHRRLDDHKFESSYTDVMVPHGAAYHAVVCSPCIERVVTKNDKPFPSHFRLQSCFFIIPNTFNACFAFPLSTVLLERITSILALTVHLSRNVWTTSTRSIFLPPVR